MPKKSKPRKFPARKAILALTLLSAHGAVMAESGAPINVIVAFPPGGPTDRIARILAQRLGETLARSVVVENKPGAGGIIAANYVARAADPENTLFLSNAGALTVNPALYRNLNYNPAKDFKPVSLVADTTTVMVTWAPTDIKDAAEFAAQAKSGKKKFTVGSSGIGAVSHLSLEMFDEGAGVELLHIPYKGAAPVLTDLVGKRVDGFFGDLPGVQGLIASGKLKVLGVAGEQRSPLLPGVRTLSEQGIRGVTPSGWYGVVMPASVEDGKVQSMASAIKRSLDSPEVRKQFEAMGAIVMTTPPAEFGMVLARDTERWKGLVARRHISAGE